MRSFIVAAAAFSASALASGYDRIYKRDCNDTCMTYDQASVVANNFATLISDYSAAFADQVLAVDYEDYTDSVITLIDSGCTTPDTLGDVTFASRAAFEAGQSSQADIPFTILNMWYACTGPVVIRWTSPLTSGTEEVTGNIVLEVERSSNASEPWIIDTSYSEFNSGAWLVDLGVFVPNCSTTSTTASRKRALPFSF